MFDTGCLSRKHTVMRLHTHLSATTHLIHHLLWFSYAHSSHSPHMTAWNAAATEENAFLPWSCRFKTGVMIEVQAAFSAPWIGRNTQADCLQEALEASQLWAAYYRRQAKKTCCQSLYVDADICVFICVCVCIFSFWNKEIYCAYCPPPPRNVSDGTKKICKATEWQAWARQEDKGRVSGVEYEDRRILVNTQWHALQLMREARGQLLTTQR